MNHKWIHSKADIPSLILKVRNPPTEHWYVMAYLVKSYTHSGKISQLHISTANGHFTQLDVPYILTEEAQQVVENILKVRGLI